MQNPFQLDLEFSLAVTIAYLLASNLIGFAWIRELTACSWKTSCILSISSSLVWCSAFLLCLPVAIRALSGSTFIFMVAQISVLVTGFPFMFLILQTIVHTEKRKDLKLNGIRTIYSWHCCSLGLAYVIGLLWLAWSVSSAQGGCE